MKIKKNSTRFISLFSITICLYGYLSINIGLPAYPSLTDYFGTTQEFVKLSITILLLGFGFSQVIWGTLSEKYGRRLVIIIGTFIAIIGSILTSISNTIEFFTIARFIEGFGAGYASVLSRTIIADALDDKKLHKAMSNLVAIIAFAPAISPILGGEILFLTSWRVVYIVLAIIGGFLLFSSFFHLKETHTNPDKSLNFKTSIFLISKVFHHRRFMGYFLPYSIILSGLIAFYTIAPYIFIQQFKFTENTYSYLLLIVGGSYAFGSILSKKFIEHINSDRILNIGFSLAFISAFLTLLFSILKIYNVYVVLFCMIIYGISCGFISPVCNTKAINALGNEKNSTGNKGITSSILGGGIMIFSSILTLAITNVNFNQMHKLSIYIFSLVILSFTFFWILIERKHLIIMRILRKKN
ncbi:multidrug effflux MFS transporter [Aureivirga marina]|uniref:multidrug effflux MFS transporter n=1 Tax=Aureivirga marina TaxID=1182451 RepID=UPI0018C9DED9|nr:multidrug effflux MFS transporter [Aureivirga marina]